jgi:hypothetical protein
MCAWLFGVQARPWCVHASRHCVRGLPAPSGGAWGRGLWPHSGPAAVVVVVRQHPGWPRLGPRICAHSVHIYRQNVPTGRSRPVCLSRARGVCFGHRTVSLCLFSTLRLPVCVMCVLRVRVRVRVGVHVHVLGMHVCVCAQGAVPSPGGSGRGPQAWPSASFSATGRPGSSSGSRPGTSAGGTRGSSGALRSSGATLVGG